MSYYDGKYLLNKKDINGKDPELYICTSNRSAGKTTYFGRYFVNRFVKHGEKFGLIYRYKYELDSVADKFFKDIGELFFTEYEMSAVKREEGVYYELFLNRKGESDPVSCGYALALNCSESIKKNSHMFSDIVRMLMDEFQSETNHYCPLEIDKFQSVHTSIARGGGAHSRRVPVVLLGNGVSLLNPYYCALGISPRLKKDTKFLRGDGFVLEQGYNESAANAQKESAFNRAFGKTKYNNYSIESIYLNDNLAFIEKPEGRSTYLGTFTYLGKDFALREYADQGIIYVDKRPDQTYPFKICITTEDHQINYVMLKKNNLFVSNMRYCFEKGCFRFNDLECKDALMRLVSY